MLGAADTYLSSVLSGLCTVRPACLNRQHLERELQTSVLYWYAGCMCVLIRICL